LSPGPSPEPPKIPPLKIDEESEPTAFTHSEKTDIFRKWFLPETEAALDDIQERTFDDDTFGQTIEIDSQVTPEQVAGVVKRAKPWKVPAYRWAFSRHAGNHFTWFVLSSVLGYPTPSRICWAWSTLPSEPFPPRKNKLSEALSLLVSLFSRKPVTLLKFSGRSWVAVAAGNWFS
jgi:hypothetical protein